MAEIGKSVERREDERFLSGRGCYVDDVVRPGMVHATIVRSEMAHAEIRGVDLAAARALPGVVGVFGPEEMADCLRPIPMMPTFTPLPGIERFLQKPLAEKRSIFVGEPVVVVLAESRRVAEDAAGLIDIDYEALEPVTDMHAAKDGRILVHPSVGTNVATHYQVSKGDPDGVFATAHYTRKETFKIHRHTAVPLETRGLVAEWDAQNEQLRVWGAAKLLFRNREILSEMLDLPEDRIELIEVDVGGAFGVRGEFYPEDFLIPFVARAIGRPVKWIEDRREHFLATNHSRETECTLEIAVDRDGMILALRGDVTVDMGAYVRPNGGVAPGKGVQFLCGPYRIKDAAFTMTMVMTNKVPFGSYRGPGRYESSYFRERIVDLAAADMGIDGATFRMRNLITPDLLPWDAGAMVPGAPTAIYDSGNYPHVLSTALDAFGYDDLLKVRGKKKDGRLHGVGIGCFVESSGGGPSEGARIVATATGRVHLFVGSSTHGQGHETVLAQILADELEFERRAIDVFHGSTSFVRKGWGTYHSRTVMMGGGATVLAARKLREQILRLLAHRKGNSVSSLTWSEGGVIRDRNGSFVASLAELAIQAEQDLELRQALEAEAVYTSNELGYTFGTQMAHVAIDPETAEIEVVRFLTVEDIGRSINPALVHGQTIGASVQGLGGTLLDHLVYDDNGQLLTGSFADYLLPTSTDFPNVDAISLEESKSSNPLGAKGAGEGGIAAVGGALANAVDDALRSLGVTVRDLPLSLNNLASLMREARAGNSSAYGITD